MKAIIFDVDGVIVISKEEKKEILKNIFQKYKVYDAPGVKEIIGSGLNRVLLFDRIYEIAPFDKELALQEFTYEITILESNAVKNDNVVEFIKKNSEKYIIFTNTALFRYSLDITIKSINIGNVFRELLTADNGSKKENIEYVLNKYNLNPKEVLFIDDNINNINKVKSTGVNTLHFKDYDIDIEKEIEKY